MGNLKIQFTQNNASKNDISQTANNLVTQNIYFGHPKYLVAYFGCTFEVHPKNVDLLHNQKFGRPNSVLGSTF